MCVDVCWLLCLTFPNEVLGWECGSGFVLVMFVGYCV